MDPARGRDREPRRERGREPSAPAQWIKPALILLDDDNVVIVAHSYGGFIAGLLAADDPHIRAAVLVDANVVEFFDDREMSVLDEEVRAALPSLRERQPGVARVLAAVRPTVERVRQVPFPTNLPVIDIVAESQAPVMSEANSTPPRRPAWRRG
jgi:pimeloyl-ACP methyl ester carboxylesterase